ncbi:alpha/beta hydrolase [Actinomycetospora sp. NBRC 106375]|uniref:alpha/beta fold hydrolase n=1 Tax=Actinomycetospora sp. NBRC 106375 TaxID=3032207 RepID=UPI002557594E|nr:alpha/beta hydrolase [Actinomycetospora sp. NBRC 106375]
MAERLRELGADVSVTARTMPDGYELPDVDVPVLVIHGTEDVNLPIGATADRLKDFLGDLELVRVDGVPHNVPR